MRILQKCHRLRIYCATLQNCRRSLSPRDPEERYKW